MKHLLTILFLLLLADNLWAQEVSPFEVNGIIYSPVWNKPFEVEIQRYKTTYPKYIEILEYVTYKRKKYLITGIGGQVLNNCTELDSIKLPNSIKTIDAAAFSNCPNLKTVIFGDSLSYIGHGCFAFCKSLNSINLPKNVVTIAEHAFYSCMNLTTIKLGESLESIGEEAFGNCNSLSFIYIPNTIRRIGYKAFKECNNIKEIQLGDVIINKDSLLLYGCLGLPKIFNLEDELENDYKNEIKENNERKSQVFLSDSSRLIIYKFITSQMRYPEASLNNRITGKYYFKISIKNGNLYTCEFQKEVNDYKICVLPSFIVIGYSAWEAHSDINVDCEENTKIIIDECEGALRMFNWASISEFRNKDYTFILPFYFTIK